MTVLDRTAEVVWVLGYLDDIESDLSAIHRVDDVDAMDAPRFFRLVDRLTAYEGVLTARRMAEQERSDGMSHSGERAREVAPTRDAISADSGLGSIVSWGQS